MAPYHKTRPQHHAARPPTSLIKCIHLYLYNTFLTGILTLVLGFREMCFKAHRRLGRQNNMSTIHCLKNKDGCSCTSFAPFFQLLHNRCWQGKKPYPARSWVHYFRNTPSDCPGAVTYRACKNNDFILNFNSSAKTNGAPHSNFEMSAKVSASTTLSDNSGVPLEKKLAFPKSKR